MKFLVLIALLIPTISEARTKTKFHFGQCVVIHNDFYEGCRGTVDDIHDCSLVNCYWVYINCMERTKYILIDEDQLRKCK